MEFDSFKVSRMYSERITVCYFNKSVICYGECGISTINLFFNVVDIITNLKQSWIYYFNFSILNSEKPDPLSLSLFVCSVHLTS
jgi:hypothetical protein